jgi:CHRD domain
VVEGQDGVDVLRFNGSNIAENIAISANGARGRLFRDIAAIDMDFDGVEQVDYNALGGADNVTIGDLAPTDVAQVRVLLAGTLGGAVGDAQADTVTVNGRDQADAFAVTAGAGVVSLARAGFALDVATAEPVNDRLVVNGLGGDDTLAATAAAAVAVQISYNGGDSSADADAGDLFVLTGEATAETYAVTPSGGATQLARVSPAGFVAVIGAAERMQVDLGGGVDTINTLLLPTLRQILDGGAPASLPGDSLNVANFTGDVFVSPIVVGGLRSITHANFEQTTNQQLFQAFLTGRQQTPPNPSPALGFGSVTLNPAQDAISVSLDYSGLLGANNAVRIHGPAPRGVAAASFIDLPTSGATSGSFTAGPFALTPARVAELKQGLWYLNVSSTAPGSSGGEIRGQLDSIQFRDGFE